MLHIGALAFLAAVMAIAGLVATAWALFEPHAGELKSRARAAGRMLAVTGFWVVVLAAAQWLLSLPRGDRAHVVNLVAPGLHIVALSDVNRIDISGEPRPEVTEAQAEYGEEQERRAWTACEQAVVEDERAIGWWQDEREIIRAWLTHCLESRGYAVLESEDSRE